MARAIPETPDADARVDGEADLVGSIQSPEVSQPILLPLAAIFGLTLVAQLISLAFGRSNQELSFSSIVLPSVLFLSAVTLPLGWIGIALGRRIGLGTPLRRCCSRSQTPFIDCEGTQDWQLFLDWL